MEANWCGEMWGSEGLFWWIKFSKIIQIRLTV